jgi:Uma2 family endonuclease
MVVLSHKALPDIRLTVDEYLQADLPEGQRYELVDGLVKMSPTPDTGHDETVNALYLAVYEYGKAHPGAIAHISQRACVPIPDQATVREPDLAVYAEWGGRQSGWQGWLRFTPFLVAEVVSAGQGVRDFGTKRQDYLLAGIPEYWIIDPQARRVTVLTRGQNDWVESVFGPDQEACSSVLPGFSISVSRLLG